MKIIRNSVKCKKCGREIVSTNVNDLVMCSCGAVTICGNSRELIRYNDIDEYVDTSILEVGFEINKEGNKNEQRN